MSMATITRDILRGAMNKHIDNDDEAALDRVFDALSGITVDINRENADEQKRDINRTATIAFTGAPIITFGVAVYDELCQITTGRAGERYWEIAHRMRELEARKRVLEATSA